MPKADLQQIQLPELNSKRKRDSQMLGRVPGLMLFISFLIMAILGSGLRNFLRPSTALINMKAFTRKVSMIFLCVTGRSSLSTFCLSLPRKITLRKVVISFIGRIIRTWDAGQLLTQRSLPQMIHSSCTRVSILRRPCSDLGTVGQCHR